MYELVNSAKLYTKGVGRNGTNCVAIYQACAHGFKVTLLVLVLLSSLLTVQGNLKNFLTRLPEKDLRSHQRLDALEGRILLRVEGLQHAVAANMSWPQCLALMSIAVMTMGGFLSWKHPAIAKAHAL